MKAPPRSLLATPLAVCLACTLAACATGPVAAPPQAQAPQAWQAELPHGGSAASLQQWWQQFDDARIGRLVEMAERDSPTLTQAWASIEKARATLRSTRAQALPGVSASASASRSNQLQSAQSVATGSSRSTGFDASWEIDLFGKVRRNAQASEARVDARTADWHDARVSLAAEVADTYVQYRACGLLADAYQREADSTAATERATATAVQAGFTAPSDAALARAGLASAQSSLLQQRTQCGLLVKSLVYLTGADEPSLRALLAGGEERIPQPAALQVQAVPAQVLRQRPDLTALEREVAATGAEIGAAQADLYPSLSLGGSVSVSASSLASPATLWSFGPSLSIPLFDGGQRRAAVDTAQANHLSALASYRQGVRAVVRDVEEALLNLDGAGRRADQAATAAREYRSYFLSSESNWRAGRTSLLTLEEARRSALSAELTEITLQQNRVQYWIALYKAVGGGWQPGTPVAQPQTTADDQTEKP
jgi:NodT family efflux transporter outer membrane factor (OMF) lipoprotein